MKGIQEKFLKLGVFVYGFEFNLELICTSEFFKELKLHEPLASAIWLFEKLTSAN